MSKILTLQFIHIDYFNTECFDRNLLISTGFVRLQKYMYMVRNMKDSRGWKFNNHYLVVLLGLVLSDTKNLPEDTTINITGKSNLSNFMVSVSNQPLFTYWKK